MSGVELVTIGAIVLCAVGLVVRQIVRSTQSEKGSCRGCGDTCSCAIQSAKNSTPGQSQHPGGDAARKP